MAEVQKNYTDEMVVSMVEQYTATPTRATVDALAMEFGKSARSVIAKLSREGVYVAQKPTTKSGAPIVKKSELVEQIEGHLGISVPSLAKATKTDLDSLVQSLTN